MSEQLQEFLDDYRLEGEQDSAGTFTLSSERALEQVGEAGLADPSAYALNLVSSAVLAGASSFSLEDRPWEARFRWDASYREEDLKQLFSFLLLESSPLRELAVAVRAVQGLGVRANLTVWDGQSGFKCGWEESGFRREQWTAEGPPFSRMQVLYLRPDQALGRLLRVLTDRRLPEGRHLSRRCSYSPIPVLWNGFSVNSGLPGPTRAVSCRLGNPPTVHHPSRPKADLILDSPVDGWVFGGFREQAAHGPSILEIVLNGVGYRGKLSSSYGRLEAYIWTDRLRTDLSYGGLVRDEVFHQAVREVERAGAAVQNDLSN